MGTDRRRASYSADLALLADAGAHVTTVAVAWDDAERAVDAGPGAAATELFEPTLHIAGLVVPEKGASAVLELDVLDDVGRRTPADLLRVAWDDPSLGARMLAAQAYVLDQTREVPLRGYVIGRRVDLALARSPGAFGAFAKLYEDAARAARATRPGLTVGCAVTEDAFTSHASDLARIWAASDFLAVRLGTPSADGALPDPIRAADALDRVAAAAPGDKPIVVLGAAYPSASASGSSPDAQARFVSAAFAAWDRRAARVTTVVFDVLDDRSPEEAEAEAARRGPSTPAGLAGLASSGFRDGARSAKPALRVLVEQSRSRGF